jgi:predicted esterase
MTTWADFVLHKALHHTWMYSIPNLPNLMEFSDIVSMTAPSPLLVLSCIDDELFTLSEVKKAEKNLRAVYTKAGCPERFDYHYHEGSHRFSVKMQMEAFDWFDRWL